MTLLIYIVCLILRKAYILNISWNLWIVCSISWSQSHKKLSVEVNKIEIFLEIQIKGLG